VKTLDDRDIDGALLAVLYGQLDQVELQVRGEPGVGWDERVHRVRTGLKASRATLRLLRDGVGTRAWREANAALRDAGRAFSDLRDWDVILLVARELSRQRRLAPALHEFEQTALECQRRSLDHIQSSDAVERALSLIGTARNRVGLEEVRGGWDGAWHGVHRAYTLGRRAWTDGGSAPDVDHLHELRKRSKDLRAQFQLFRAFAPRWPARPEAQLEPLVDRLGDERDLDLFGLAVRRAALPELGRVGPVLEYVDATRRRMLCEVKSLVTKLYGEDPRTFVERTRSDFEGTLADRGWFVRRFAVMTAVTALATAAVLCLAGQAAPAGQTP